MRMEWIEELDRSLLLLINENHSPVLDQLMWFFSGKIEWIPLYLILVYLVYKKYRKASWIIFISVALLIVLSDQTSVKLFKEIFKRYRPCHNLEIQNLIHLVNDKCGGKFGFVSSHATNSFALATFVGLVLNRRVLLLMFFWATIVSFSRIYLGVHYPLDVLGGAILGVILSFLVFRFMSNVFKEKLKLDV